MNKLVPVLLMMLFMVTLPSPSGAENGFTQKDRELLIELKTKMEVSDKRFVELREDMNKRFEQVDKRFVELREDMNKRFEQVDKRFEQVDKRFEQMMSFVWILAAIFAAIVSVTIGFALWDRRTMVRPFETKVSELDKRIAVNRKDYESLLSVLKEYSGKNKTFANIIHRFNLF